MARKFNAGYYFSEGFHSIFTHGFMSFAAVCMIVACLLIMGSFSLLAVNLNHMLGDLEKENEFLAYVDDSYSEEEARALQSQIEAVPNVSQVTFVSKEEALNQFLEGREHNDLLDSMPATVLRDRYRIHVDNIEQMEQTTKLVEQVPGVAKVNAAIAIAQGFVLVRNIATGVALVLIGILAVVSLFIIANTIKLATFYRREEIAIMKMCGATDAFIQWPFVVEGMILGLTGALVASPSGACIRWWARWSSRATVCPCSPCSAMAPWLRTSWGCSAAPAPLSAWAALCWPSASSFRSDGKKGNRSMKREKRQRFIMAVLAVVMILSLLLPIAADIFLG